MNHLPTQNYIQKHYTKEDEYIATSKIILHHYAIFKNHWKCLINITI
jgi:hypothetical protein